MYSLPNFQSRGFRYTQQTKPFESHHLDKPDIINPVGQLQKNAGVAIPAENPPIAKIKPLAITIQNLRTILALAQMRRPALAAFLETSVKDLRNQERRQEAFSAHQVERIQYLLSNLGVSESV